MELNTKISNVTLGDLLNIDASYGIAAGFIRMILGVTFFGIVAFVWVCVQAGTFAQSVVKGYRNG